MNSLFSSPMDFNNHDVETIIYLLRCYIIGKKPTIEDASVAHTQCLRLENFLLWAESEIDEREKLIDEVGGLYEPKDFDIDQEG